MNNKLRDFFDPVSSQTREHPARNGVIVLAVGTLLVVLVVLNKVPFLDSQPGYKLTADFAKVNQVDTRTPVRVDGVDVGIVTGIGPGPDPRRTSQVTMRISQPGLVIHSDATASIRWRTVLGGSMYIDLNPGSPDAPRLGGTIPAVHTSYQTELDSVLRVYNGATDQQQRNMISGLSRTFAAPPQIGNSIHALSDLRPIGTGIAPYQGTDPGDLSRLVASAAHTVADLGASTTALSDLVDGASATLGAVDRQRVALGQLLALSPGTLSSTELTAHRLDITLARLDPLVARLQPGARLVRAMSDALAPALKQARKVLTNARPLLHSARPTFANLRAASSAGVPLLAGLRAPVKRLNGNILPWLGQRSSDTKLLNYEAIGPFFSVLDKAAAEYDSSGYRLHLSTLVGSASVVNQAALTQAKATLSAQCRSDAAGGQQHNCGPVTNVLLGWLYGGQK